ncbi:MAG: 3-deoxy-D-manno-octulosonic acid transferase [Rhizobiales bacterium]|nr:3-deoxy-D-manno-octulosonic acid transferase [Hyphomicrobiales bacterium]
MGERLPLTLHFYRLMSAAATPLSVLLLASRKRHGKEHPTRVCERRGVSQIRRPSGPLVWVHGASVGEFLTVVPMIHRIRAHGFHVLVTTGTVTSAEVARTRLPSGCVHQFAPLDAPRFAGRFLDHWRPDLAIFVESDLWPNLIIGASSRSVPMIVVNGRVSERSFRRWQRAPATIRALLERFDLCLAQSKIDADRYAALGAAHVDISGNLKLDVPAPQVDDEKLGALTAVIGSRRVLGAASTHPGEDMAVIEAHRHLRREFPGLLTIIAPRHPERGMQIADAATAARLSPALRSRRQLPDAHTEIYVADTIGELGLLYRLASVVFMGGSLVEHGGQNPIEAIKLGAAVLHGPHVWNFAEVYTALDAARGAAEIEDARQLTILASAWLRDPALREHTSRAALKTVDRLSGALDRTFSALEPYLMHLRLPRRRGDA